MLEKSYIKFLDDLKIQIKQSRIKAHLSVNRELILLYYEIGLAILEKQKEEGWGSKIIERVAKDLKQEFPEMTGLSYTNIQYMQRFAKSCCEIYPQLVGKLEDLPFFNIPWGHNREIIDSLSEASQKLWYANQTIKNGWSRNVLMHQIKSDLYQRQTSIEKTHNFDLTLPNPQSELYHFHF
jgi:predicted nuclease of restriction endonuclease-like (RecB) superfamily